MHSDENHKPLCRIIILNYNGEALLKECLPSIIDAAHHSKYSCSMTILDNQSRDNSQKFIEENYASAGRGPLVDFVKSPQNLVYCSFNDYIKKMNEPFAILLNNDIKVDPKFIDPLLDILMEDKNCFLAASQSRNMDDGAYHGSLSKMEMKNGLIWGTSRFIGHEKKIARKNLTMQAGYGAFRRDMFVNLGGFDTLYLPGTVEDTDLCFRAYRKGWRAFYCPESIVYHYGQMSFKKEFGISGLRRINRRNLYFFVWKNIRDPWLLIQHLFFMPLHLLKYIAFGEWDFILGFKDALIRFPEAMIRRIRTRNELSTSSDREIFALSKSL